MFMNKPAIKLLLRHKKGILQYKAHERGIAILKPWSKEHIARLIAEHDSEEFTRSWGIISGGQTDEQNTDDS